MQKSSTIRVSPLSRGASASLRESHVSFSSPVDGRSPIEAALEKAIAWSFQRQSEKGFWVGRLESNACMEAQWILAMHFLGVDDRRKWDSFIQAILDRQRSDGSWEIYHGAPEGDINTTVECYAALRAAGYCREARPVRHARKWIFEHGGLERLRVFTRYWLALIGEWPWKATPAVPPELIAFPKWFPIHLYHFSSWARATLVPLCVLRARCPVRRLPESSRLDELFPEGREKYDYRLPFKSVPWSLDAFFWGADRFLKFYSRCPFQPGRETAIRLCLEWILRHQDADGFWGGIQPPWIYSLMALNVEGYPTTHPAVRSAMEAVEGHWSYEKNKATYVQASDSIVWDTALTLIALLDAGCRVSEHPAMRKAVDWLVNQQVLGPGDWQVRLPNVEPGGWAFERANRHYPDCDDTAVVLQVLARVRDDHPERDRLENAIERGRRWLLAMQCRNGGWAAFDRDNTHRLITKIPFCDFGEVLDPPSVDVTAHVVETLDWLGEDPRSKSYRRACRFLLKEQEPDGSWFGRWGVNHLYGTGAVLPALSRVAESERDVAVRKGARWLVNCQNADGGWGESPASYMDPHLRGKGKSTASQTSWALMALLALPEPAFPEETLRKGLAFLVRTQKNDGTWDEPEYTGTGFPGYGFGERLARFRRGKPLSQGVELERGFMINYTLYRHYFPMMALARAGKSLGGSPSLRFFGSFGGKSP